MSKLCGREGVSDDMGRNKNASDNRGEPVKIQSPLSMKINVQSSRGPI